MSMDGNAHRVLIVVGEVLRHSRPLPVESLQQAGIDVAARVLTRRQLAAVLDEQAPDLALIDVEFGAEDAAEELRRPPGIPFIMLTGAPDEEELLDCLRAGASGYLPRDAEPDALGRAVHAVHAGEGAFPRAMVAKILTDLSRREPGRPRLDREHGHLTEREWDVLELLREGLNTGEIADRLYISPGTVRSHVAALLHKLEVPSRDAAVKLLTEP